MNHNPIDNNRISTLLQAWFEKNKRDLPWRKTNNAYVVWISEIILQQTRVNQGLDYFLRFIERFPDASSLASAHEDEVLKLWQGLGYYSRARNLHAAAKQIVSQFGGEFPQSHDDIISLRGVGEYTAAAVASIAYNQPYAVVDGNVFRVLARLFAIETPIDTGAGKKEFAKVAQLILDKGNPGNHNQAIMELGALVCTPAQPKCDECPLQVLCETYEKQTMLQFPKKQEKTKQKERYFNYFHINHNGFTYIAKRGDSDIWKNLYEFPLIETDTPYDFTQLKNNQTFINLFHKTHNAVFQHKLRLKHVLTHRIIFADFYRVELSADTVFDSEREYIKIESEKLADYPVSRLIHKYLETI